MRYELFFGSLKVGMVTWTDSDFPNHWGNIVYDESLSQPRTEEVARFIRFLALERESIRLIDMEHERDVSKELSDVNTALEGYMDFIETDDWQLVDERGRMVPILAPVLRGEREIVWRWNPTGA